MEGDEFGSKALHLAAKRKFDYSFSSSSDEEVKEFDGESADEIEQALFVERPIKSAQAELVEGEQIPIHRKVIAEDDSAEEQTARSFQSSDKSSSSARDHGSETNSPEAHRTEAEQLPAPK